MSTLPTVTQPSNHRRLAPTLGSPPSILPRNRTIPILTLIILEIHRSTPVTPFHRTELFQLKTPHPIGWRQATERRGLNPLAPILRQQHVSRPSPAHPTSRLV